MIDPTMQELHQNNLLAAAAKFSSAMAEQKRRDHLIAEAQAAAGSASERCIAAELHMEAIRQAFDAALQRVAESKRLVEELRQLEEHRNKLCAALWDASLSTDSAVIIAVAEEYGQASRAVWLFNQAHRDSDYQHVAAQNERCNADIAKTRARDSWEDARAQYRTVCEQLKTTSAAISSLPKLEHESLMRNVKEAAAQLTGTSGMDEVLSVRSCQFVSRLRAIKGSIRA